ncbi:MAG: Rrf2 family transcriptional regulator [Fretibacterium sp.]|nr:Rrf2 family transcriptional regulator [Fretibacterium sp.]
MKLSTVTRYGLRALSDLCSQGHGKPVTVSDISRRQDISASYLEQLFAKLRRGNIVRSVRGARGGYLLTRPASEITVAEVVRALGESIVFGDCQTEAGCSNLPHCRTSRLWGKVKDSIDTILESTTLDEITEGGETSFISEDEVLSPKLSGGIDNAKRVS